MIRVGVQLIKFPSPWVADYNYLFIIIPFMHDNNDYAVTTTITTTTNTIIIIIIIIIQILMTIGDITKTEDCERIVAKTIEYFGRIDVLVSNRLNTEIVIMMKILKMLMMMMMMMMITIIITTINNNNNNKNY